MANRYTIPGCLTSFNQENSPAHRLGKRMEAGHGRSWPLIPRYSFCGPYEAAACIGSATSRLTTVSITASARARISSLGSGTIGCGTVMTLYDGIPKFVHWRRAASTNSVVAILAVGTPCPSK